MLHTFGVYTADVMRAIEAGELDDDTAPYSKITIDAGSARDAKREAQSCAEYRYGAGAVAFPLAD